MGTYQEMIDSTKGGDGASLAEQEHELTAVRNLCMTTLDRAVIQCPNVLTNADKHAYAEDVMSDKAFAASGIVEHAEKVKALKELADILIPKLANNAKELEGKFRSQIENAMSNKWIGRRSVSRWMKRLAGDNAYYYLKKEFIENPDKFPKYLKNWQKTTEARKKLLGNSLVKKLSKKDVRNLNVFLSEDAFLERPFEERQNLVAAVQAAIAAKERQMPQLHAQAKSMLEGAARNKSLSWNKVGVWMNRIFQSSADAELIEQFLNGSGAVIDGKKMTLSRLITNWGEASTHFRAIEDKCQKTGTPRGFHFVKMNVFLEWSYEQRDSYLKEAENRFNNIKDESYVFVQIQHELGAKDWDSAEDLIDSVKKELADGTLLMGKENRAKLQSMEKFLREHRSTSSQKGKDEQDEDPQAMIVQMQNMIQQLPPQLRFTYIKALNKGYQAFWALTTLMYNRVWCHQHNFLDPTKERKLETEAKEKTRERIEQGHEKVGHEANVLKDDTDTRAAVRNQSGVKGAQMLFTNEQSAETLVAEVDEQKNDRNFWYWTSMIPEGVMYAEHLHIVQTLHPLMKKLARTMESKGARYPLTVGTITPSSLQGSTAKKGAAEPQFSPIA